MRIHFSIVVLVLLMGALCRFDSTQMSLLVVVSAMVLMAEMFNTAVESVVDMVTQSYHPLAKLAKDIAAGAVLIAAVCAALVGFALFFGSKRIVPLHLAIDRNPAPLLVLITLVVLVMVIVLISKVLGGKGSILSGGIVSGHSAVSFLLAVTIIYRTGLDYLTLVLAVLLALLVAQSRVEGKIHTLQEVIIGGLLGICLTTSVYFFAIRGH